MASFLVLATAGAGGDLQPLVSAALALRERDHRVTFLGDASVESSLGASGLDVMVLPPSLDLGPRLIAVIREAIAVSGGDPAAAGPLVQQAMTGWARDVAGPTGEAVRRHRPDALFTSLFGVEALYKLSPSVRWAVINSTFALGGEPERPLEEDFGPRAVPLIARYRSLLGAASLVLHATDPVFDFGGRALPAHHRYVGPLGICEPDPEPVPGLDDPGDSWVLVTISSQLQDDIGLAQPALSALADRPVRVLLTLGPGHHRSELSSLPRNAHVESVVSHAAVLERAVLLLSHAGHGSAMKALWHGRPMVPLAVGTRSARSGGASQGARRRGRRPVRVGIVGGALGRRRLGARPTANAQARRRGRRAAAGDEPDGNCGRTARDTSLIKRFPRVAVCVWARRGSIGSEEPSGRWRARSGSA